jgi:hypothetical protein
MKILITGSYNYTFLISRTLYKLTYQNFKDPPIITKKRPKGAF